MDSQQTQLRLRIQNETWRGTSQEHQIQKSAGFFMHTLQITTYQMKQQGISYTFNNNDHKDLDIVRID